MPMELGGPPELFVWYDISAPWAGASAATVVIYGVSVLFFFSFCMRYNCTALSLSHVIFYPSLLSIVLDRSGGLTGSTPTSENPLIPFSTTEQRKNQATN